MNASYKVLVVGDDPTETRNLGKILSGRGYAVATASSGEDALWKVGNDAYDAVCTDIEMRGLSGLDVAEEIHDRQPWLPVVLIATADSEAARQRAVAAGVVEFLLKPLPLEQVTDSIGRVIAIAESPAPGTPRRPETRVASVPLAVRMFGRMGNVVLFIGAPLFALASVIAFPVIGAWMLLVLGIRKLRQGPGAVPQEAAPADVLHRSAANGSSLLKAIVMVIASIVIGVVFGILGPIIGIIVVIWFSLDAWARLGAKAIGASEP